MSKRTDYRSTNRPTTTPTRSTDTKYGSSYSRSTQSTTRSTPITDKKVDRVTERRERDKPRDARSKLDRDRMTKVTSAYKSTDKSDRERERERERERVYTPTRSTPKTSTPNDYYVPIYPESASPASTLSIPRKQQEEYSAVVIDHGSKVLKAGVGGEMIPRYVCQSLIGRPRHPGFMAGMTKKDYYVGDEAQQKREVLSLNWPMDCGLITNYDDATKIWTHIFRELEIPPEEQPVIWTETSLIRQEQREKVAEIFYETLGISAIHFNQQAVLSVYAAGLATAMVVDLGEKCDVVPVYEGGAFSHVSENIIKRLRTTGNNITSYLEEILGDRGYYFSSDSEHDIVSSIKERACYVAQDPDNEITQEMTLTMPDGQQIFIGNERYRATESLFVPALVGKEGEGLHALIYHALMETSIDMRVEMARSILLTGGTSMFPGLNTRIEKELSLLVPSQKWEIVVIAPNERKYAAWIGGSILATLENFDKLCVAKELWEEIGPSAVTEQTAW